jgi:hypothetical protein
MRSFKPEQKTVFKMNMDDEVLFPELATTIELKKTTSNLNFLEASQRTPRSDDNDNSTLKPGWVHLTLDDKTKTVIQKKNDDLFFPLDEDHLLQDKMNYAILSMIYTWDKYRKNYEELNGEDAYQYNYCSTYCIEDTEYEADE